MYVRGVFSWGLVIVISVFLAKCTAQFETRLEFTSEDYWKNKIPLQCYDCNSQYDPRCGDPFNPYSIGIVNCSDIKPPEHLVNFDTGHNPNASRLKPTVCRKIVQKIENRTRVIRECGYIQDDHDDKKCFSRSGTKDISVTYCSCTKSLCNTGINIRPSLFSVGFFLSPIVYLVYRW